MTEHLQWRGGRAYYRRRIPDDAQKHFQKTEYKRSLNTSDKKQARLLCAAEHVRFEQSLYDFREQDKRAKDEPDQLSSMNDHDMSALALRWLDRTEQKMFDMRVEETAVLTQEEADQIFQDAQIELQEILEAHRRQDTGPGLTEGAQFLERQGITFNRRAESFSRFGHYMNHAILRFHQKDVARLQGRLLSQSGTPSETIPAGIKPITIGRLFEKYLNDPKRTLNPKTVISHNYLARLLIEVLGKDVQAYLLEREDCENLLRLLKRLPSNAKKRYPNLSAKEAADRAEHDGCPKLSVRSVNKHMQMLSSVLSYGIPHKHVTVNVAAGLTVKDTQPKREKREKLSVAELKALFQAPIYTGCKDDQHGFRKPGLAKPRRHRFWVPLIGIYSAMRLNEICQLHAGDIQFIDNIWVYVLKRSSDTGEKALKTDDSVRNVPIHPELLKIGIIEFRNEVMAKGGGMLFPELKTDDDDLRYPSDIASKSILRVFRSVGIKRTSGMKDLHSMRKTYNQLLQRHQIPPEVRNQMGGWAQKERDVRSEHYDGNLSTRELYEIIQGIQYEGLDLSHLYLQNA